MNHRAITVDEQIEILLSRGMAFYGNDFNTVKEYLLDIGYYRMGFYWRYYEMEHSHNFKEGTLLNDVIKLYHFDLELRNILSPYIYRIEVHFKTQLTYYTSNKYKDHPSWFLDKSIVEDYCIDKLGTIHFQHLKKSNLPMRCHYREKFKDNYDPDGQTIGCFTFGQAFMLYKSLKDYLLKQEIAAVYGIRDMRVFTNYISCMVNIRNACSHNVVLFDFNQPRGIVKIPSGRYKIKTRNQTNINSTIRLTLFILSKISQSSANELEGKLKVLFDKSLSNKKLKEILDSHICFDL